MKKFLRGIKMPVIGEYRVKKSDSARGFSMPELLITLAIGVIVLAVIIATIVTSLHSFYREKTRLAHILKQRELLTHLQKFINCSSYGLIKDDTDSDGFGNTLELYNPKGALIGVYSNTCVTDGNSVRQCMKWQQSLDIDFTPLSKTVYFKSVVGEFKKTEPISGNKATEINIRFLSPLKSNTYIEPNLDLINAANCCTTAFGARGCGYSSAVIKHTWITCLTTPQDIAKPCLAIANPCNLQEVVDVSGDPIGYMVVAEHKCSILGTDNIYLGTVDRDGIFQWARSVGREGIDDWAKDGIQLRASKNGGATGYFVIANNIDLTNYVLLKLNTEGREVWRYESPFPTWRPYTTVNKTVQCFDESGNSESVAVLGQQTDERDSNPGTANFSEGNMTVTFWDINNGTVKRGFEWEGVDAVPPSYNEYGFYIIQAFDDENNPNGVLVLNDTNDGSTYFDRGPSIYSQGPPYTPIAGFDLLDRPLYESSGMYPQMMSAVLSVNSNNKPNGYLVAAHGANYSTYVAKFNLNLGLEWDKSYGDNSGCGSGIVQMFNSRGSGESEGFAVSGFFQYSVPALVFVDHTGLCKWKKDYVFYESEEAYYFIHIVQAFDDDGNHDGYVILGSPRGYAAIFLFKTDIKGNIFPEIGNIYTGDPS